MFIKLSRFFLVGIMTLGAIGIQAQNNTAGNVAHKGMQLKTIILDPGHGLPDPGTKGKISNESDIALAVGLKLAQKLRDSIPGLNVLMTRMDRNLPNGMSNKNLANRWRAKFANENHGDLFISIHVNDDGKDGVVWHSEVTGYNEEVYYTGKGRKRKKHVTKKPIINRWSEPSGVVGTETYIWAVGTNDDKTRFIKDNEPTGEFSEKDTTSKDSADSSEEKYFDSPEAKIAATLRVRKYFERSLTLGNLIQNNFSTQGRVDRGVRQRDWERIWVLSATAMPSVLVETGFITDSKEEEYLNSTEGQEQIASAIFRAVVQYKNILDQRSSAMSQLPASAPK